MAVLMSIFTIGKLKILRLLSSSESVQNLATTFSDEYATPTEIGDAGCQIMLNM